MKKKVHLIAVAALLLFSLPAFAEAPFFEVIGRATWINISEDTEFDSLDDDFAASFESETGYGLAGNFYFFDHVSLELGASVVEPEFELVLFDSAGPASTQGLEMIPITATAQYHFNPGGRFDVYIGGGAAYILFDDVDNLADLIDDDVEAIEIDDEIGWVANAGLNVHVAGPIGFNFDVKYIGVEAEAVVVFDRGDFTAVRDVRLNPVLVSAGVSWKF